MKADQHAQTRADRAHRDAVHYARTLVYPFPFSFFFSMATERERTSDARLAHALHDRAHPSRTLQNGGKVRLIRPIETILPFLPSNHSLRTK